MTPIKIESERDRASGKGGLMPVAAGAGCPARTRLSFCRANERRLARFVVAVDWLYVRWALAWTATALVLLHVAMGRAA